MRKLHSCMNVSLMRFSYICSCKRRDTVQSMYIYRKYKSRFSPYLITPFHFHQRFYSTFSDYQKKIVQLHQYTFQPIRIPPSPSPSLLLIFPIYPKYPTTFKLRAQPLHRVQAQSTVRCCPGRFLQHSLARLFLAMLAWELADLGKYDSPRRWPRTSVYLVNCRIEDRDWYLRRLEWFFSCCR